LERKWLDEFDRWAANFDDPWVDLEAKDADIKIAVASQDSTFSWESAKRNAALESDGIAAEVLFPNTSPPFFPSATITAGNPTTHDEYEARFAGLQAHNRWMIDFCAELPGRRAGLAQIFFNDVDDAVTEIRRAAAGGLRGVLLPSDTSQVLVPYYYPRYDRIWEVCEELEMPIHRHANFVGDPVSPEFGYAGPAVATLEGNFFAHRSLGHLIVGGVFDRFPGLKYVTTETGSGWVVPYLKEVDAVYAAALQRGSITDFFAGDAMRRLGKTPSEYYRSNCYVGASLLMKPEVDLRHDIGIETMMWGSDLPHREGTYPYTLEALRAVFSDVPPEEVQTMLGTIAADVYRLDIDLLRGVADRIGPTVAEVAKPLSPDEWPRTPEDTVHPGLFPLVVTGYGTD